MNDAPEERSRSRNDFLAVLFLLLLTLFFFRDVLFGDRALITCNMSRWLPWRASASVEDLRRPGFRDDAAETYFPRRFFSWQELREGRVPLWNRYILCGAPHLADFQSSVFHPLNLLLSATDHLRAMGAFVAIHLFLGGWFLYKLLRSFRIGAAGSLVGALSFLFNAYFATYLGHPPHIATGCWLPLLFLLGKRYLDGGGGLLFPAAVALAVLGGFPQTLLYSLLALAAFALFVWGGAPRGERKGRALRVAGLGGLLLVGIGLVLFQIVPTAELGRLTARREVDLSAILSEHQPGPLSLIRALLPDFFGNPVSETYWLGALYGPFAHPSDLGFIGYAGVLPLFLAVSALFLSRRREVLFFALLAAAALALAFSAPVFSFFYRALPLARFSSELHRLQFPFLFGVAVLAGFGYEEIRARARPGARRGIARVLAAWLLLLPIGASLLHWEGPRLLARASDRLARIERADTGSRATPIEIPAIARHFLSGGADDWRRSAWRGYLRFAVIVTLGSGALLLHRGGARAGRAGTAILLAAVAADGWTFARLYYTPQPRAVLYAADSSLAPLRDDKEPFRVARMTWEYLLPSNTGIPYGIEDLQGVNALMPGDYGALFRAVHPALYPDGRRITPFRNGAEIALPVWDLLGTRYFLLSPARPGREEGGGPDDLLQGLSGLRIVAREPFTLVENTEALPRSFLRHAYHVEKNRERVLSEIVSPTLDPRGPLWLEEAPGIPSLESAILPEDSCAIVSREGSSVTIRTTSPESGLLFLSETFFPGWEALVDDARKPILRADYAFRAVALPRGEHTVVFRYRPLSFRIGLAGSALSLLVYASLIILRRRAASAPARGDLSR